MTTKKYVIELRIDVDDDKHETVLELTKQAAYHLYSQASLIQDKRQPQIALSTNDFFAGAEEIMTVGMGASPEEGA